MRKKRNQNIEKEEYIRTLAAKDICKFSAIALLALTLLELCLFVFWAIIYGFHWTLLSAGNLFLFGFMALISLLFLLLIRSAGKNPEKNKRRILLMQWIYSIICLVWITAEALLDMSQYGTLNFLIIIMIMTLIPVLDYLDPLIWGIIECIMLFVVCIPAHWYEVSTGASILTWDFLSLAVSFTLVSILVQALVHRTKRNLYDREYELMHAREEEYRLAHTDALTGFGNRRSYFEQIDIFLNDSMPDPLLLVSMDVNSLKRVNDTLGHEAGDELIVGAADTIRQAFSSYGMLYRTGGDEFIALLEMPKEQLEETKDCFYQTMRAWKGEKYGMELSISAGFVFRADYPELSLAELGKIADQEMYAAKEQYYHQSGHERRRAR